MKIIRNKESLIVSYLFDEAVSVELTDRLQANGHTVLDINSTTHELLSSIPEPDLWVGSALKWNSGWSIANQELYDNALLEQQVKLEAEKAKKNIEINASRLAANFSTFPHAGKVFACDVLSRSDIDGTNGFVSLYGVMPPGWLGGWKAVDNTYLPIATISDWKSFYASLFAAGSANFAKSQQLKAALQAATSEEEILNIKW